MPSDEVRYTNKVFMAGALPLMKTIATDVPELKKKFEGVNAIYQVSAMVNVEDKEAVHFIVENGEWSVKLGEYLGQEKIDGELAFSSMEKMNAFMKGDMTKLPKMKIKSFGKFLKFMQVLLKMSALLGIKDPKDVKTEADQVLLCKLYFYLLSSGISQLNKLGHPDIHEWALKSPDRCYQWEVVGHPECTAYIRVKAGKSRAGRGEYKRAKPFFNMKFDCPMSALAILMGTGDMFEMTANQNLMMEGGPEFGVQIGDYMMIVGALAS
ncbi:MAG: hypothetical protein PUE73_00890 [Eubacteriales bacterium]|nr:hypothetical protein [Eubacteriales bacterium]